MDEYIDQYAPSSAMSMSDFVKNTYGESYGNNSIGDWASDTFGKGKSYKSAYSTYLDNLRNENEYRATQSARAWELYLDNTKYQRAINDLQKAGLNPWLALQNSGVSGSGASSSAKADYNYNKAGEASKSGSSGNAGRNIALAFLATAKLIGTIAMAVI